MRRVRKAKANLAAVIRIVPVGINCRLAWVNDKTGRPLGWPVFVRTGADGRGKAGGNTLDGAAAPPSRRKAGKPAEFGSWTGTPLCVLVAP